MSLRGPGNGAPVGGGGELVSSGFPGFFSFFFFSLFFFLLHHPEPNRAMLVGVGGGGWQLLYLPACSATETGLILSLQDYNKDTVLTGFGRAIGTSMASSPTFHHSPLCWCWFLSTISVLIWLLLCTTQIMGWLFFFLCNTSRSCKTTQQLSSSKCPVSVLRRLVPPAGPR